MLFMLNSGPAATTANRQVRHADSAVHAASKGVTCLRTRHCHLNGTRGASGVPYLAIWRCKIVPRCDIDTGFRTPEQSIQASIQFPMNAASHPGAQPFRQYAEYMAPMLIPGTWH